MNYDLDWGPKEVAVTALETWHGKRQKGIGSSDVASILGISPFTSIKELWKKKTGRGADFKGNWATERGQRLEPIAREKYEKLVGDKYPPEFIYSKDNPVFLANFDGINHDLKIAIEIKCPGQKAHQMALLGEIPDYYYCQCQWLLMVCEYNSLFYISWDGESEDMAIIHVQADKEYQMKMKVAAAAFWSLVEQDIEPGDPVKEGEQKLEDEELIRLLTQYSAAKAHRDIFEKEVDSYLEKIQAYATSKLTLCGGFKMEWVERRGVIDYTKVPQLKDVNLEQFRKNSSKYLKIGTVKV
jgi:putative phage-type endonuclease